MTALPWLDPRRAPHFPDPGQALEEPPGLLAAGGRLSPEWLLKAYSAGIFPWYDERSPILWWSPDPRMVLLPGELHISSRLARRLRRPDYRISLDQAFDQVIAACADTRLRPDQEGTWITAEMRDAYQTLHQLGHAHSIEVWQGDELIGGLYGVGIGRAFFGESMFSRQRDGSKIAMAWLDTQFQAWGMALMDCQIDNPHLRRMGARNLPREDFLARIARATASTLPKQAWHRLHVPDCCRSGDNSDRQLDKPETWQA
ncbi:leucyl/phenylalanyl-tRNA--protein transferase [Gammaproteobacteria bacterium AB-CW1]|uniref:Leucyl/phenylalanyl-tRNA--protein transferase n=1 Tax=Natronospira elongata TaxID=3110268 RepID=A0AAP6JER3_9GAMM|nr:leucyl/phenylalanyl-tRNA--protein transferase [Gammaproteobacteria bacterium AB-CW1]